MRRFSRSDVGDLRPDRAAGAERLTRVVVRTVLAALLLLFLWLTIEVDLVLFAGVLLAIFLRTAANGLSARTGLSNGWALAAMVALIGLGIAVLLWLFANDIASQVAELSQRFRADVEQLAQSVSQVPIVQNLLARVDLQDVINTLGGRLRDIAGIVWTTAEIIAGLVVIAFIGIYLAAEAELYRAGLLRLVPPARRVRIAEILGETGETLWFWILGRLFSMTTLGILTGIGLWALGVPAALALGLLAGLLFFVPYLGAIISAVPSIILALAISPGLALWVVLLYLGIHILEGYLLVPLVQRKAAHLPPALTLATQVILGVLAGALGVLFATPLLAAALVLVRTLYVEDTLGDLD